MTLYRKIFIYICLAVSTSFSCSLIGQASTDSIAKWQALISDGQHSAELYEQLGFTFFEQNDLANSRLYYEKAHLLDPRNNGIKEAIHFVQQDLPVQVSEIPDFILVRAFRATVKLFSPLVWSILQVALGGLFLYLLYTFFRLPKGTGGVKWYAMLGAALLLSICAGGCAHYASEYAEGGYSAVVMESQDLYESPDTRSEVVTPVGPGNKVLILDQIDEWVKVELADKDIGWINQELIRKI